MADNGPVMNEHHIESTSYRGSNASYTPENFRHIIQRQIQHTVDRAVDSAITLSIGDFDGRFLGNFPGRTQSLQNGKGQFYHVAGVSRGGDLSVAAP